MSSAFTVVLGNKGSVFHSCNGRTSAYCLGRGAILREVGWSGGGCTTVRSWPWFSQVWCRKRDKAVPCNEPIAVVALGLWLILSTALVVNSFSLRFDEKTAFKSCSHSVSHFTRNLQDSVTRDWKTKVAHLVNQAFLFLSLHAPEELNMLAMEFRDLFNDN